MSEWKNRVVGLGLLVESGIAGAAMFKFHPLLEDWPLWALSIVGILYIITTIGGAHLLLSHAHYDDF